MDNFHQGLARLKNEPNMDTHAEIDLLNEMAACFGDQSDTKAEWDALLNYCESELSPKRRELIAISIFEILAEDPISDVFLNGFNDLLSRNGLWWIIIRLYEERCNDLINVMKMVIGIDGKSYETQMD